MDVKSEQIAALIGLVGALISELQRVGALPPDATARMWGTAMDFAATRPAGGAEQRAVIEAVRMTAETLLRAPRPG